jgi:hypothetical protein
MEQVTIGHCFLQGIMEIEKYLYKLTGWTTNYRDNVLQ